MMARDARRVNARGKAPKVNRQEDGDEGDATLYIPLRNSSLERSAAATKTTLVGASTAAATFSFGTNKNRNASLIRPPSSARPSEGREDG